jgi:hypothetical protein
MAEDRQHDQFGKNADAARGGGASTDRGGRDAGSPGPVGAGGQPDERTRDRAEPQAGSERP